MNEENSKVKIKICQDYIKSIEVLIKKLRNIYEIKRKI